MRFQASSAKTRKHLLAAVFFIIIPATLLLFLALTVSKPSTQSADNLSLQLRADYPPAQHKYPVAELSKGKFLVASRGMRDPRFSETVILLIDYSNQGAVGVIINRPSDINLSEILPTIKGLKDRDDVIHIGGPVGMNQLLLLVRSRVQPDDSRQVFRDVYVSSDQKALEKAIQNRQKGWGFRIYSGYAGWAPRQLDNEISRGDWHVAPADANIIFNAEPARIWPDLIQKSAVIQV
jgi:putative transcriptional regulator